MRFVKQKPSAKDKEVPVFVFAFCFEEMRLMYGLLRDYHLKIPKIFETMPHRSRLGNIVKELEKTIRNYENE